MGKATTATAEPFVGGLQCLDATFRPINHAYVHSSASGSGDSCPKPDMRSTDSNTDNSRPNTGHYTYGNPACASAWLF